MTATNSDQYGNEVDTALDVAITLQLPKLKVNGVLGPLPFGGIDAPGGSVDLAGLPNSVVVRYPTIAPNTSRTIIVHSSVPRGFVSGDGYSISASLTSRDDLCGVVTAASSATGTVGGNPFLRVAKKTDIVRLGEANAQEKGKAVALYVFEGMSRVEVESVKSGDLVCLAGLENVVPGDTIVTPEGAGALPRISVGVSQKTFHQ